MKPQTFPTVVEALLLVLALILLEVLIGAALTDIRGPLGLDPSQVDAFATLLGNGIVLATVLQAKGMGYAELLNPSRASVASSLVLLGLPILATVPLLLLLGTTVADTLAGWFPLSAWEQQAFERMSATNLAALVSACVLAPVLEEMLFRGVILRSFLVHHARPLAIGASALIFGAAHLNLYQFCIAFGIGLYAGWLYARARSLVPCIVLHAAYNIAVTLAESRADPDGPGVAAWLGAALLAAAGAAALLRVLRPGRLARD